MRKYYIIAYNDTLSKGPMELVFITLLEVQNQLTWLLNTYRIWWEVWRCVG